MVRFPCQSGDVKSLKLAMQSYRIECDFEVIEKTSHPKQPRNRQIERKCGTKRDNPSRCVKRNVVKVDCRRPCDAVGGFWVPFGDIQSNGLPELCVTHTASSPGIYDGFKSL